MISSNILLTLLFFTASACAGHQRVIVSPNPAAAFNPLLAIRQEETCSGITCPSTGDCIPTGHFCCSDGAGCPIGDECIPNGCCGVGESCVGAGTMTLPGGLGAATTQLAGLTSAAAGAAGGLLPSPQTMDVNTLTGSLDSYKSFLKSEAGLNSVVASLTQIAVGAISSASAAGGDVTSAASAAVFDALTAGESGLMLNSLASQTNLASVTGRASTTSLMAGGDDASSATADLQPTESVPGSSGSSSSDSGASSAAGKGVAANVVLSGIAMLAGVLVLCAL